jgi:hypothetical protein
MNSIRHQRFLVTRLRRNHDNSSFPNIPAIEAPWRIAFDPSDFRVMGFGAQKLLQVLDERCQIVMSLGRQKPDGRNAGI